MVCCFNTAPRRRRPPRIANCLEGALRSWHRLLASRHRSQRAKLPFCYFCTLQAPSTKDRELFEGALRSWYVVGKLGGYNGTNLQLHYAADEDRRCVSLKSFALQ